MAVLFRSGTLEDLHDILQIEHLTQPDGWSENTFISEIEKPNGINLVAEENGKIFGFIFGHKIDKSVDILTFSVHPYTQGKGVGRALLEHFLNLVRSLDIDEVLLDVRVSNTRAIMLYEKFGFSIIHTRKNFYADNGENAYVMRLNI